MCDRITVAGRAISTSRISVASVRVERMPQNQAFIIIAGTVLGKLLAIFDARTGDVMMTMSKATL